MNSSGGYQASVPLDLPGARGGLPVPVRIVYTERGVGAAGLGWDVPLSYVRRDTTFARRRPVGTAGVAPQGREQLSVVLDGRRIDLVQTATAWVARRDAPDIELRAQADGSWVMFDGQGRTYLFSSPSPALIGTNLWLLTDVSSAVGSKLHLDYGISALSLAGGPAISIDLTSVSYNSSPTTTGCYKNTVDLAYDSSGSAPLSIAVLNGVVMARMHKLTSVDVSGVSACGVTPELIRSYQLAYQADVDTGEPRLVTVHVVGRAGTLENQTPMPIASYQYGSASSAVKLVFQPAGSLPSGFANLGNTSKSTAPVSGVGQGYATALMFTDVTGDGRPDRITFADGQLSVARNISST
ncbi:MAG TPA: hypothetical protein VK607_16695, partial [Kofleriaceae bacterium]|nr:hypothetical protein [Kofleriaceae bacterium]